MFPQRYASPRPTEQQRPSNNNLANPFDEPAYQMSRESANFIAIGGLMTNSKWDDDDYDRPPPSPRGTGRPRAGTTAAQHLPPQPARHSPAQRVRSVKGQFDNDYSDDEGRIAFNPRGMPHNGVNHHNNAPQRARAPPPGPGPAQYTQAHPGQGQPRALTRPPLQQRGPHPQPLVVDFPSPNMPLSPRPHTPPNQVRRQQHTPPTPDTPSSHTHSSKPDLSVQILLQNQPPISPMLAAPPRAHFSPLTPPPSPGHSITAFDIMREKKATFREGDEEVFSPFSPRARQAGPRAAGRSGLRPKSVADMWKRMSTMQRTETESGWMMETRRSVWRNPYFVFPLVITLLAVAAIVVYLVIRIAKQPELGAPDYYTTPVAAATVAAVTGKVYP